MITQIVVFMISYIFT